MSRWRASGLHFLISLFILVTALALIRLLWYPDFYFAAIGADGLLAILFAVDVTLGPLITLIIFRVGKKGLGFDLTFIAACQLAALLYGMHTVFLARPVFAVFSGNRFEVVQAVDLDLNGVQDPEFQTMSWTGPRWASLKVPQDEEVVTAVISDVLAGGKDFQQYARFLAPYEEARNLAITKLRPLQRLRRKGVPARERVENFLSDHGVGEEEVGYLPLTARAEHMAVIVTRANGDILGVVRVNPW